MQKWLQMMMMMVVIVMVMMIDDAISPVIDDAMRLFAQFLDGKGRTQE